VQKKHHETNPLPSGGKEGPAARCLAGGVGKKRNKPSVIDCGRGTGEREGPQRWGDHSKQKRRREGRHSVWLISGGNNEVKKCREVPRKKGRGKQNLEPKRGKGFRDLRPTEGSDGGAGRGNGPGEYGVSVRLKGGAGSAVAFFRGEKKQNAEDPARNARAVLVKKKGKGQVCDRGQKKKKKGEKRER